MLSLLTVASYIFISSCYIVTTTYTLDSSALKQILTCLWSVRTNWFTIGVSLSIDAETLKVIRMDHPHQTDQCFTAVIEEWLRNGRLTPCWKTLAETLRLPPADCTNKWALDLCNAVTV